MSEVTVSGIYGLVPKKYKPRFLIGVSLRVLTNFFDLFALAGVGLLALIVTSSAESTKSATVKVPMIGELQVSDQLAVVIAMCVAMLFLLKSLTSIKLNNWIGRIIAEIETDASRRILKYIFLHPRGLRGFSSISSLQNVLTVSLNSLFANLLTSTVTLLAEVSLLLILVIGFLIISPWATLGLIIYLAGVVVGLNFFVASRVKKESKIGYVSSQNTLQGTRDLFSVRREAKLNATTSEWVEYVANSKFQASHSAVRGLNLNGIPRYVIESSLIFGVFLFMGVVLLFSSLAEQSIVIGVFLTGGLRLVASMLPLQAAVNTFRVSTVAGQPAFSLLVEISKDNKDEVKLLETNSEHLNTKGPFGISVSNLSFGYGHKKSVLKNISFEVKPGTKFAIVGPSGSGKSTLFELLLGFETPDSGDIEISGVSPEIAISNYSGEIGFVPQKPTLISGTFLENLTLSKQNLFSITEIEKVLELAGLSSVVSKLSKGLNTELEPDSTALSGGEIQRLGLARALLRNPKLLLLDEATSALDAATEYSVTTSLDNLKNQTTILVIAHRLSTVQNADTILYLDKGEVQGTGNFDELVKSVPNFAGAVKLMKLK